MKDIIIESLISSQKTAILEDGKLSDIYIEDNKKNKIVGNIYRGIVKKVIKGIEACFIDIGLEKMAYLQLKNNDIKAGQEILVQVNKEEVGTKGAKLNSEISIAGRYLVYIPSNDRVTISNKIDDEKERFRLKKIVKSIIKEEKEGFIIRTEAVGCSKEELEEDIIELKRRYVNINKEYKLGMGPKKLYSSLDFSTKYVNDNINEKIGKIVTNNRESYEQLKNIIKNINKEFINKLILEEDKDVFDLYKVNEQIQKYLNKKVWLKSGGYLIIEKTEALTVIDVNTGKFTGNIKLDETVYKTNIEAAIEISKQIKIRDIAGIIIVDFIDMNNKKYKEELLSVLKEEVQKDKRKTEILGMTRLGLVEIARRREKDSIYNYYLDQCNSCSRDGYVKSIKSIIDDIEKEVIRIKEHTCYNDITIEISDRIYTQIMSQSTNIIDAISKKYDIKLSLNGNNKINYEKINIIYNT